MIQISTDERQNSSSFSGGYGGRINASVVSSSGKDFLASVKDYMPKFNEEKTTEARSSTTSRTSMGINGFDQVTVLSGATITAYGTSIFQRLRLLDGINY